MLRRLVLLLLVCVSVSGCGDWVSKLEPEETGFARHCFDLLQHRDFEAIDALADPELRAADLDARLGDMAALIPSEAFTASQATSVNVSTTNGDTRSTVGMIFQFPSGALQLDISSASSNGVRTLTS